MARKANAYEAQLSNTYRCSEETFAKVELTEQQKSHVYASEADVLNVALFGKRAREWREKNLTKKGNIRDFASSIELAILSNLEYQNAKLIEQGVTQRERLIFLNEEANREKELFNNNCQKVIYRLENKK